MAKTKQQRSRTKGAVKRSKTDHGQRTAQNARDASNRKSGLRTRSKPSTASKRIRSRTSSSLHSRAVLKNRRKHRRYAARNLWVTEYDGDYQFSLRALDLSEGGIFLAQRMKMTVEPSLLAIPIGAEDWIRVEARPVHDRISAGGYGTGYQFLGLTADESKALRNFLRNLD